ncbi:alpha/beta hydrolase [Rhodococcus sp. B10]|uniref:alpha/beta hydrolase n=1 Tax=Rhodococcus sp. B10 TaxID=2695876 RepID=UPI001430AB6D|nr:alpha/beta hydrolase [Rhodococcus sp. B10]NIL76176.1 hypothetical protein [Rhodococcus sp. B10]
MSLAWGDVRNWNPSEVGILARRIRDSSRSMDDRSMDLAGLLKQLDWHGPAADAARAAMNGLESDVGERARVLNAVGRCLDEMAIAMYPLTHAVRECAADADGTSMSIGSDGTVVDGLPVYTSAAADAWGIARDRLRIRRELEERAVALLARAEELDGRTAESLNRCENGEDRTGPATVDPPMPGTPAANAAFWDAATQAERTELLVRRPELLGNLDGIPAHVRDAANRRVLAQERTRLAGVLEELRKELQGNTFGGAFSNADAGLAQTEKRLGALDAVATTLAKGNRQLLVLDNHSADDTLAAVAVGDVDTATHVAVFVPGMNSDVQSDMIRYDGDMDALEKAVRQQLPSNDTAAVVTWMNYSTPHTGWSLFDPNRSVAGAGAAVAGGARLTTFLDGLDASRRSDPHLSLLGHSYGSLTAAHAVRDASATGVDEFVSVGSPGLGVGTVHELSIPPGHIHVGEAAGDVVVDLGVFGADPSELAGVEELPTTAAGDLRASDGHSDYFTDGTTSQHAIARVVAGLDWSRE